MRLFSTAFVAGTAALQLSAALPDHRLVAPAAALLLALRLARRPLARALLVAAAGFAAGHDLAAWRAQARLADELPAAWEGRDIEVEGVVSGLPHADERGTRFLFEPRRVATPGARVPARIRLAWHATRAKGSPGWIPPPAIRAGESWRLAVRLKRPRGLANPHGFDFESWALERGIRATGYVRPAPAAVRLSAFEPGWPQSVHRVRERVRDAMRERLGASRYAGVLVALAIGDQDAITPADWTVFWRTGIGHLVSISGLHVTMLASLAFAIASTLWSRVPALVLAVPARKAGAVAGVAAAAAYTLLAGFGVPAQRTLAMLATAGACVLAHREASPSRVLAAAALAVLAMDPWAVLAPGFWLSFGAVGAIFLAMALRDRAPRPLRAAAAAQAAVTLALWPLLAAFFGEVSLVSPLANAFAIPLVSLVIVPLTLAGSLLPWPGLLEPAHALVAAAMAPLEWLAGLPFAVAERAAPPAAAVATAAAGAVLLLAPRGLPLRWAGLALLLPLAAFRPPAPVAGEAWVDVLDVGQGLAVVVRTSSRALAYDAGPSWNPDSDGGSRVVVPYLRGEGIGRLDGLVVSHADDDHAGGARSVAAARDPAWMLANLADGLGLSAPPASPCVAGIRWSWDGVEFEVLHPARAALGDRRRENDRSCVLRVASAGGVALLTGDIERRAESELVSRSREALRADALLVPHHGSRTSSTPAFVAAVSPSEAVVSAGWRNRFGQPAPEVVARYRALGAAVRRTDHSGALRVRLPPRAGRPVTVDPLARCERYWCERSARGA